MWNIGFNPRVSGAGVNTGGATDAGRVQGDNRRASLFGNDSFGSNNGYGQYPQGNTPWWGGAFNTGVGSGVQLAAGVSQVQHRVQSTSTNCFDTAKDMCRAAVPGASIGTASDALLANGNASTGNNYIQECLKAGLPVCVGVRYDGQGYTNQTPGRPGHALVLQMDRQTGQIMAYDPATSREHAIAPVSQDAQGRYVINGYQNYIVTAALRYTDPQTQSLVAGRNPGSMIG